MTIILHEGNCLDVLPTLAKDSIDAVLTDPPYHLTQVSRNGSPRQNDPATPFGRTRLGSKGITGKTWDGGDVAMRPETWVEVLRVLKPGGHMLCSGGTRTYHRMVCAIEDAGFDIREQICWLHSSGMPKSHHSLKPAFEPIVVARRPPVGSVETNIQMYGVGGLNIDACRIPINPEVDDPRLGGKGEWSTTAMAKNVYGKFAGANTGSSSLGRWPANVCTDSSDEVLEAFAQFGQKTSGVPGVRRKPHETYSMSGKLDMTGEPEIGYADSGSIARFYYAAKVSPSERGNCRHPTMKPLSLMKYLARLITPKNGIILDPFAGSGTTGEAAALEGFNAVLIEREAEYCVDIRHRLSLFME